MTKRFLISLIFILMLLMGVIKAQQLVQIVRSNSIQKIDGKEYYLHQVEQGQTLWAITRAYNCTEDQIKASNPEYDGILRIGQILKIPKETKPASKEKNKNPEILKMHLVQRGETLYGIARLYSVSIDSLMVFNKLEDVSLKPGQELRIPPPLSMIIPAQPEQPIGAKIAAQPQVSRLDTTKFHKHTVAKGETLYSLSKSSGLSVGEILDFNPAANQGLKEGMILNLPALATEQVVVEKKPAVITSSCNKVSPAVYKVALLMPLFSGEAEKILIRPDEVRPPSAFRSFNFIHFYEGMLLSFDELEKEGVKVKFFVYDTYRSDAVIKNILEKPDLASMDMIIGPFYSSVIEPVIAFTRKNNIIHISPFANLKSQMSGNTQLINLQASVDNQVQALVDYACDSLENPNIIVVHNNSEEELEFVQSARQNISAILKSKGLVSSSFKEINYKEAGFSGLRDALLKDKNNLIITLIRGEAFVASYLTTLNKIRNDYPIYLVVNPNWLDYSNIDLNTLVNLNGVGYSSYFINYDDAATSGFIARFRERYKTEPDPYAFQGYDIAWFFLNALHQYGKNFINCLDKIDYPLMHTHYSFEKKSGKAIENTTVNVFRYQDYNLVLKYRR